MVPAPIKFNAHNAERAPAGSAVCNKMFLKLRNIAKPSFKFGDWPLFLPITGFAERGENALCVIAATVITPVNLLCGSGTFGGTPAYSLQPGNWDNSWRVHEGCANIAECAAQIWC
jgi:hypothetical protein